MTISLRTLSIGPTAVRADGSRGESGGNDRPLAQRSGDSGVTAIEGVVAGQGRPSAYPASSRLRSYLAYQPLAGGGGGSWAPRRNVAAVPRAGEGEGSRAVVSAYEAGMRAQGIGKVLGELIDLDF
jgi:hypothetical protein